MEKYHRSPVRDYMAVANYAGSQDFDVEQPGIVQMKQEFSPIDRNARMPDAAELKEILREMGKTKPEDELNCGSCGYDTCREKAVAIYQGKAEISMCLPFLKEKAESFSNAIAPGYQKAQKHIPNRGKLLPHYGRRRQHIHYKPLRRLHGRSLC